jgi:hypothetical protein
MSEAELLRDWAAALETALHELATTDAPPLHVCCMTGGHNASCLKHVHATNIIMPCSVYLSHGFRRRPQIEQATCARYTMLSASSAIYASRSIRCMQLPASLGNWSALELENVNA